MEHDIPEANYGFLLFILIPFNFIWFSFLFFDVQFDYIFYLLGIILSLYIGHREYNYNFVKRKLIYLLFFIAGIVNLIIFQYLLKNVVNEFDNLTLPDFMMAFGFMALLGLGVVPGYLMIKTYQHFLNKKLHKKYWDDLEDKLNRKF